MVAKEDITLLKKWLTAIRPFAYTASGSAVFLGLAVAEHSGYTIDWWLFALTLFGVVLFHTAANLLNDSFDFARGLDLNVHPMSGAVVRGWLTRTQITVAALGCLFAGIAIGFFLVHKVGWPILGLGVVGFILAMGYTGPRFCFKYVALGDLCIFLSFGVLPVFGAYWVQARDFSWLPILWSLPVVLLTVAILHANNWRDLVVDKEKGCRTIANLLGEAGSASYYRLLVLAPFLLVVLLFAFGRITTRVYAVPWTVMLVALVLPFALRLAKTGRDSESFVMLDGRTARLQLGFGALLVAGFLLG